MCNFTALLTNHTNPMLNNSHLNKLKLLVADQRKTLKVYALGALLFFIGVGFIQWADKFFEPSLQQESYALGGVLLAGTGFFIAMIAQVLMIVQRFTSMGKKNTQTKD